ncbi:hypothetical protein K443DRAFT_6388 [Laccaria amethystina LaAM-08-1]|uniref:Uncharacterized protein n=1 Tax=Laccaria amethystina LaAM-08-1 TaxID=1095629 RepID=A0A0C9XB21_9AGAR|nr:hypothetical protein K443DRAFT_6388 [Laccaria amethystina LaAM-08-1]
MATGTHIPNGPTPDDEARADTYKTQAHSAGNAAPPWFGPALNLAFVQHLTPIKMTLAKVSALHNP